MKNTITVVSGLPRSGTSMMMAMLEAGGKALLTDNERPSDTSNPNGYFEFAPVAASRDSIEWVSMARGKAVKVIYALLDCLPPEYQYQVIFMLRDVTEVAASQAKLLAQTNRTGAEIPTAQLVKILGEERERSLRWIKQQPNFSLLTVRYEAILENPLSLAQSAASFLGTTMDVAAMASIIDPALRTVNSGSRRD